MLKYFIKILIFVLAAFSFFSCANIVAPTGGPKDIIPPKILDCTPENFSKNFNGKEIKIHFDKYITLKDINKNLIISPLIKNKPDFKIKGKNILIKFVDSLKSNTTYALNFGDAITDITEGNVLKNFHYVFSTGKELDSLIVKGKVINSFDLTPQKDFYILLHHNLSDSSVIKNIPDYVSKTNISGEFSITNVHEGKYHIFCLNDVNNNFLFDQPNEDFAFYDSLVIPKVILTEKTDTIKKDSIVKRSIIKYLPDKIILKTFLEDRKKLFLSKSERKDKYRCSFIFSKSLDNPAEIFLFGLTVSGQWNVIERNITNDSLICWITDTLISNLDTLNFILKYHQKNQEDSIIQYVDTVKRLFYAKPTGKMSDKTLRKNSLNCNVRKGSVIDLNKYIVIESSYPVSELKSDKIILTEIKKDSLKIPVTFSWYLDSLNKRRIIIDNKWKESTNYKLIILPGTIQSIYNLKQDTLAINFRSQSSDAYGNIILNITGIKSNIILQFLTEKNILISEYNLNNDKKFELNNILPGNYNLKIIYDKNNDSKWTTGSYLKKLQPENVQFYKEKINVRANWDVEVNWDISK